MEGVGGRAGRQQQPPGTTDDGYMDQVQNPVTYLDRGDPASGAPVLKTTATGFAAQQMADRNDLSDATGTPFEAASPVGL